MGPLVLLTDPLKFLTSTPDINRTVDACWSKGRSISFRYPHITGGTDYIFMPHDVLWQGVTFYRCRIFINMSR